METVIRLKPSELNMGMLEFVKMLVEKKGYNEISISLTDNKPAKRLRKETPEQVQQKIEQALLDINSGTISNSISFSADEFEHFSQSLVRK